MDFIAQRIELRDVEVFHIEEAAQLLPHFPREVFLVQRGAQSAADFIQYVKLFRAPRSLLNQVAVLDRHADLVPEREEKPKFRGRKAPVVRCAEEEHAERLFFGLQADGHHAAKRLRERQLAEPSDGFFLFEGRERIVTKIAKSQQSAKARHQADEIIIQAFILCDPAKLVTQAHGHDGGRTLRITVMKEESAGWQTHNTQHAVQSLRQHALNLAAHKTGSRQIEVGEGQHISFDAAFFFFVERHDHEHGDKRARRGSNHVHAWTLEFRRGIHDVQGDPQNTPGSKGNTKQPVGQRFLPTAFLPEHGRDRNVEKRSGNEHRNRNSASGVRCGPECEDYADNQCGEFPGLSLRVELRSQKEEHTGERKEPMIQSTLQRGRRRIGSQRWPHVMKREYRPSGGP